MEGEIFDTVAKWIKDLGFPIVVALYVLLRQEPKLNKIQSELAKIQSSLNRLTDMLSLSSKPLIAWQAREEKKNG